MRWLGTLRGQFVAVVASAVLLSSLAVFFILETARASDIRSVRVAGLIDRVSAAFNFIAEISPGERPGAMRAMGTAFLAYTFTSTRPFQDHTMNGEERELAEAIRAGEGSEVLGEIAVRFTSYTESYTGDDGDPGDRQFDRIRNGPGERERLRIGQPEAIEIAQAVGKEGWMLARFAWPPMPQRTPDMLIAAVLVAFLTSAAAAWFARRVSQPLSALAVAAGEVARGRKAPHLLACGPRDLRQAAEAFNAMSERVSRTMDSHRQLLSAVGHDLRTPLAAMRITTEFVEEGDVRARLSRNLDELQALTEAVLSAARFEAGEEMHRVDLAALVESVCEDLIELDQPVETDAEGPAPCMCRSNEIRRAVRNLIENAVRYGGSAFVTLGAEPGFFVVAIEDNGPGIPNEKLDSVFEPFVRLDQSRSSLTGGSGLGLSLARTIAREHGGDVTLENRPEGGLRALLRLPREHVDTPGDFAALTARAGGHAT